MNALISSIHEPRNHGEPFTPLERDLADRFMGAFHCAREEEVANPGAIFAACSCGQPRTATRFPRITDANKMNSAAGV